jgi:uncharacterized protein (TIGR02996 family)
MTNSQALLAAILANPDDDTLRLVYADALEEEGDARRAAFVRAQVALARLSEYDPARVQARYHGRDRAEAAWLPELPRGLAWDREPFRRGLPGAVQADNAFVFVRSADDLFARFPIESLEVKVVRLTEARDFARCPWLSRLVRLSVTQGLGGQSAAWLLDSPHYERLRELRIGPGLTTRATAEAIVRSQPFRQLTALSCRDNRLQGRDLVDELTRLPDPPRLQSLGLAGNRLTADHLTRLFACPVSSEVEELDLGDNTLGADAVRAVASAELPHLRGLHLHATRPEEDGVRALAEAGFLAGLRGLTLGGNNLSPTAAALLAGAPGLAGLRVLDLRENRLGDPGAAALAGSGHLRNLVSLDLATNQIGDPGAVALAESPHFDALIHLDLSGNFVSDEVADRLERRFGDRVRV